MTTITREHEICCGHRVVGHESGCRRLHGHNYTFQFTVAGTALDTIGRVIDFSVIKSLLCQWLEDHWDHKTLLWVEDPWLPQIPPVIRDSVVTVPFNPTAENIAGYFLEVIGPQQLAGTGVELVAVQVHETRKCSARVSR